jgi:hypothetical protein
MDFNLLQLESVVVATEIFESSLLLFPQRRFGVAVAFIPENLPNIPPGKAFNQLQLKESLFVRIEQRERQVDDNEVIRQNLRWNEASLFLVKDFICETCGFLLFAAPFTNYIEPGLFHPGNWLKNSDPFSVDQLMRPEQNLIQNIAMTVQPIYVKLAEFAL